MIHVVCVRSLIGCVCFLDMIHLVCAFFSLSDLGNKSHEDSLRQAQLKVKEEAEKKQTVRSAPASTPRAAGGLPDMSALAGLMGGGGGGLASLLQNPAMMQMAQQMMQDPSMMAQAQQMMGGGGGGGGLASLLQNPAMMQMAQQMMQDPSMMAQAQQMMQDPAMAGLMGGAQGGSSQVPAFSGFTDEPNSPSSN